MIRRALLANAVAILFALGWAASAEAAAWWEKNFWMSGPRYDNMVPLCEDPAVLGEIRARFAEKERRFWQSKLEILGFERIQQTAANPWRGAPDFNSPPVLQRRGARLRPAALDSLLDRRGYRMARRQLGRGVVRGRPRPQLGLQPEMPDGPPLSLGLTHGTVGNSCCGAIRLYYHFVLDMFLCVI